MILSESFPIRMTTLMKERIREVATRLELTDQQAARLMLGVGYADLKKIDYNLASAVVSAARGKPKPQAKKKAKA